jgi:hypothetical protein
MIVNDFHIPCMTVFPSETYPPLIVDADAPLSGTFTRQQFQSVAGRYAQFLDSAHGINELEFSPGYSLYVMGKLANEQPGKYRCRSFVLKGFNHLD